MRHFKISFNINSYEEHALNRGSNSKACSYVAIQMDGQEKEFWGAGIDDDIIVSSVYALISAVNRAIAEG